MHVSQRIWVAKRYTNRTPIDKPIKYNAEHINDKI